MRGLRPLTWMLSIPTAFRLRRGDEATPGVLWEVGALLCQLFIDPLIWQFHVPWSISFPNLLHQQEVTCRFVTLLSCRFSGARSGGGAGASISRTPHSPQAYAHGSGQAPRTVGDGIECYQELSRDCRQDNVGQRAPEDVPRQRGEDAREGQEYEEGLHEGIDPSTNPRGQGVGSIHARDDGGGKNSELPVEWYYNKKLYLFSLNWRIFFLLFVFVWVTNLFDQWVEVIFLHGGRTGAI